MAHDVEARYFVVLDIGRHNRVRVHVRRVRKDLFLDGYQIFGSASRMTDVVVWMRFVLRFEGWRGSLDDIWLRLRFTRIVMFVLVTGLGIVISSPSLVTT